MNRITLCCGTNEQMDIVAESSRDLFNNGMCLSSSLVQMHIDCGTIDDLKSIARDRAHHAITNTPDRDWGTNRDCGTKIGMGVSGDDYSRVLFLIIQEGAEQITEITRLTTKHNFKEDCINLLKKCLAAL